MQLIVQKYGGASLASAAKLKAVAQRIAKQWADGDKVVIVVSAMGRTTDELLCQVKEICEYPMPRELDAVLSTGEILSAAKLSMALNSIGCLAKSFTGAQAGIITDQAHSNAAIQEINTQHIEAVMTENCVVILAGFQGVTAFGDTTTLGRGGSDTTAVALAARLGADRCEILKDVPAIFSANPNVVTDAFPIRHMNFVTLLDMTFWGAKVLNYRAVEIAKYFKVPLYVGPAHWTEEGTFIKENNMIEDSEILSLSSHETVLRLYAREMNLSNAFLWFRHFLERNKIIFPQILDSVVSSTGVDIYMTASKEVLDDITERIALTTEVDQLCSVTATCRGSTRSDLLEKIIQTLENNEISISNLTISSISITVMVEKNSHERALLLLHRLVRRL